VYVPINTVHENIGLSRKGKEEAFVLAGVSMKIGGLSIALLALGVSFYRWSQASERKTVKS